MQRESSRPEIVALQGITKAFPGCVANDAVNLSIKAGSVHALLGENGAGKSTLVKILFGLLKPDAGQILWQGQAVTIDSPAMARELGIAMVFQHFSLFDSLSVLENIALGMAVDASASLRDAIIDVSGRYGLPLDPDRSVYTLSVGERQRIEIVRCLLQEPQLLIMDEPTSVLTPQEVADLFGTLRRLSAEGMAIVYISHKLDEIRQLCDEATILRAGKVAGSADPAVETPQQLARLMMGELSLNHAATTEAVVGNTLLSVNGLTLPARDQHEVSLCSIELDVHAGEIVGVAGVAGNGQDELLQALAGERRLHNAAELMLLGQATGWQSPGARRRRGLCSVPEERLGHAAVPTMTLAENAFLTAFHRHPLRRLGFISHTGTVQLAEQIIARFKVQCRGPHSLASSLSGGNLQKFIVGREIIQNPTVLIAAQPTWGVDAGAAAAIHAALRELAAQGSGIVLISQDLDELKAITDRIAALCGGRLSPLYRTREVSVQDLGLLMGGESLTDAVPLPATTDQPGSGGQ